MRPSCNAEHVMYILWQMPQISKLEYLGGQCNSKRCCYVHTRCLAKNLNQQLVMQNGLNYFPYCPIYALLAKQLPFKPTLLSLHQLPPSFPTLYSFHFDYIWRTLLDQDKRNQNLCVYQICVTQSIFVRYERQKRGNFGNKRNGVFTSTWADVYWISTVRQTTTNQMNINIATN